MNNNSDAYILVKLVCQEYNISIQNLHKKKNIAKKKETKRKKKSVSLSAIRQALSYFILMHFPMRMQEIATLVGYTDHSPISSQRKQLEFYITIKDSYFYPYYKIVEMYATKMGIEMSQKRYFDTNTIFIPTKIKPIFEGNQKKYENA